jgi:methylenetetrahydrofolate dehydrogenase (NADP+)/methenyltetrahydrofolate cyclohydrolase
MGAILLDGRGLAARLRAELVAQSQVVANERGRRASLALLIAGENVSALLYGEQVQQSCARAGVDCVLLRLPGEIGESELRERVTALGRDSAVDGVALLLPLPEHIRQRVVTEALPPEKDVDGLGPANAGRLMLGFPSFVPSTADAALELLRSAELPIRGLDAVVVGRSNVGGKPAALLFLREGATVTLCHSRTPDLATITRQADLLFVSVGQAGLVTGKMVKPGAIVLDAGLNVVEGRLAGDVDFASAREVAGYLTPTPGGLGPVTNLMLIRHTVIGPS